MPVMWGSRRYGGRAGGAVRVRGFVLVFEKAKPDPRCDILGIAAGRVDQTRQQ